MRLEFALVCLRGNVGSLRLSLPLGPQNNAASHRRCSPFFDGKEITE